MRKVETKLIKIKDENDYRLRDAAKLIVEGKLVVFPTETVYGLGANARDKVAVGRIFKAKDRPSDNPLIVHVSDMQMAETVANFNDRARMLTKVFWPGPLTLVLPKSLIIPSETTCGLDTVAVRMPDNKIALELIRLSGTPIAASSANISGKPSATKAAHALRDMKNRVEMVIDGGPSSIGIDSTLLDITSDEPVILRLGAVTLEQLRAALGNEVNVSDDKTKSPGTKYQHYTPNAKVIVFKKQSESEFTALSVVNNMITRMEKLKAKRKSVEMIVSQHIPDRMRKEITRFGYLHVFDNEVKMAQGIFEEFRNADDRNVKVILVEEVEEHDIGTTLMNVLRKAANGNVIEVE